MDPITAYRLAKFQQDEIQAEFERYQRYRLSNLSETDGSPSYKPQTGWNREQWLRLLSGTNSGAPVQPDQASRSGVSAEIIGRTGYPLYRS